MDAASAVAQSRLRDLLRASTSVVEQLDLDLVLHRIVDSARSLASARYGALGVIGPDGALERFLHVGIDDATVRAIGEYPHGRGLLGAVIADRRPIRLPRIGDDPRSVGFPAHHPAMTSFLGVPIRVRDAVYGNLYLAEAADGAFTDEDEELVVALAATAGIAIENARLFERARTREAWTAALADVLGALLDTSHADALEVIVDRTGPLFGAQLVTLAVPLRGDTHLRVTAARGTGAEALRGRVYPVAGSLAGHALRSRRAAHVAQVPAASLSDISQAEGPTVALPLFSGDEALGVLTISRAPGAPEFGDTDLEMAFVFAAQAGVAIEVVRGRDDRRRLDVAAGRGRIARDLHDHVIQRLYAAGLTLQSITPDDEAAAAAVNEQIDALDAAIREIRTVIVTLGAQESAAAGGVRDRLLTAIAQSVADLDVVPRVRFRGAIDLFVPSVVAADVIALVQRALMDAAAASTDDPVDIELAVDEAVVLALRSAHVTDALLADAAASAAAHGGGASCTGDGATAVLVWSVPLEKATES